MLCGNILALALIVPAAWSLSIDTHFATETTLLCSTTYGKTSLSSISTSTSPLATTIELSPVILHNSTTLTRTVTPKPFSTLFSILTTKTKHVTATPVNGTFSTTTTKFKTSTFWHHTETTVTKTKYRYLTSRTTSWIAAPTGFLPVRNTTSGLLSENESKQDLKHPHAAKATSKKAAVRKPTAGSFAAGVGCVQHVRLHTTEVLMLTETKVATVTLRPETVYKNRTVYGTITSTALLIPSSSLLVERKESAVAVSPSVSSAAASSPAATSTAVSPEAMSLAALYSAALSSAAMLSAAMASAALSPAAIFSPTTSSSSSSSTLSSTTTKPLPTGPNGIATFLTTVTKTPYTITFTYTATKTSTVTSTRHATTTLTLHSACATSNLLSQTSKNQRINGVTLLDGSGVQRVETKDAGACCEVCVGKEECAWSVWEAEGRDKGACYLVLVQGDREEREMAVGRYGYRGGNGEVRYVVSNGVCGLLSEV